MTASPGDAVRRIDWRWFAAVGVMAVAALLFGFRSEFLSAELGSLYLAARPLVV